MTLAFSWGRYGGFYIARGAMLRVCLGWLAITFIPREIDDILTERIDARKARP